MACRCADVGLDEIFDEQFARRDAQRYRRKGLPRRSAILLDLLAGAVALPGITSLEGGAGAGAVSVELARRGAARVKGIDATPIAVQYARGLAADFNLSERVEFETGDFADPQLSAQPADVVILDRVVCCYPDWRGLLANAATHAHRAIALSYPPDNTLSAIEIGTLNAFQRVMRRRFRVQLHSTAAMFRLLAEHGFTRVTKRRYWFWEIAVAARL
jgi:magnesium-protoporphyrin O-methyltransferase